MNKKFVSILGILAATAASLVDKPQAGIRFWSSVSKDGINPTLNDCGITDKNGKAVIKAGTLKEPGVLRCSVGVYNPDTKKETQLMAGAAFELDKIRPGLPVPADFAEYWKAQKRMLSEIPMNVDMKEVPCDNKNVELFDIKADTFKGFLTGYYARPKGAKPKSCPAILFRGWSEVVKQRGAGCLGGAGVHCARLQRPRHTKRQAERILRIARKERT